VFSCPHCSKPIEVTPQAKVPWWRHRSNYTDAILLTLLVAFPILCNARGEVQKVRNDIQVLVRKIEDLQLKLKNAQREAP